MVLTAASSWQINLGSGEIGLGGKLTATARRTGAKVDNSLPDFVCFVGAVRPFRAELFCPPSIPAARAERQA